MVDIWNRVPMALSAEVFYNIFMHMSTGIVYELPTTDSELQIYKIIYKYPEKVVMCLYKDGMIYINTEKIEKKITSTFLITDYINDDSLSLVIGSGCSTFKLLVNRDEMLSVILQLAFLGTCPMNAIYKNKPKIPGSQYGSRLHDIDIVCE